MRPTGRMGHIVSEGSDCREQRASCLIVANGSPPESRRLLEHAGQAGLVIATDGAAQRMMRRGVAPGVVVGDLDSLAPNALEVVTAEGRLAAASRCAGFARPEVIHVPDQSRCDLEKAIEVALGRGFSDITVVGALGRRWDHSLTSVSLLVRYVDRARVRLVRGRTVIQAVAHSATIEGKQGDRLSLVAFAPATGVCLSGVEFPLADADLAPGSLGVSNRMTADRAELRLRSGCLIVCHTRRSARSAGPEVVAAEGRVAAASRCADARA
ncbi:MAG: thiamine diphosphokinase [Armatimonadetes bacterium]|nr:thiamine diphosphokinase [Armatimonadota bacterium]